MLDRQSLVLPHVPCFSRRVPWVTAGGVNLQAGRRQPYTASSRASAGESKQCKGASVHSSSLRRRDLLTAGGVTLGATLLLQSPAPAWALEPPPEGSPALKELYADCQKVIEPPV